MEKEEEKEVGWGVGKDTDYALGVCEKLLDDCERMYEENRRFWRGERESFVSTNREVDKVLGEILGER